MRWTLLIGSALALSGCILDSTFCGKGWRVEDGQCVPLEPPPPFYPEVRPDRGAPDFGFEAMDAFVFDIGFEDEDAAPPLPVYPILFLVDQTGIGRGTEPTSPGFNLDAVTLVTPTGREVRIQSVFDAFIADPFGVSQSSRPSAVTGAPNGRFLAMGGEGAWLFATLSESVPPNTVARFHRVDDSEDESLQVFFCYEYDFDFCTEAGYTQGNDDVIFAP